MGEDTPIKHPDFALPGKNALLKSDKEYEVVLIDATETPIERPKKKVLRIQFYPGKKRILALKTQGGGRRKQRSDLYSIYKWQLS
ncbi:putative transposase for insertion sequence element IS702 [Holospora elegans E1]|uniref:Putative transposase for insertion sequence element IS702 n=1 Tax=Holospora elegans E1 TaxID=1427503 RepID=A0A023DYQ7_9PROT|nr:putative transposase for insertion sequence element IS702 [Holospora elegans E1]